MFKRSILNLALFGALAVAGAQTAHAVAVIGFDPDGAAAGSGTVQIGSLDWAPNSALALGGNTSGSVVPIGFGFFTNPAAFQFSLLSQGSLIGALDGGGGSITLPGLNSAYEITFVSRFVETVGVGGIVINGNTGTSNVNFSGIGGGINFFEVYYSTTRDADPLAGTGYNNGQLILSGTISGSSGTFSSNLLSNVLLDQFNGDNWGGQRTVQGTGGTTIDVDVSFQDNNFWKSNISSLTVDAINNTNNNLPFTQQDPSRLFAGASGGALPVVAPNIGAVNGGFNGVTPGCVATNGGPCGPDVLFQTDASTSFNPVPEPASMALLGVGLVAMGSIRRRALRNKG